MPKGSKIFSIREDVYERLKEYADKHETTLLGAIELLLEKMRRENFEELAFQPPMYVQHLRSRDHAALFYDTGDVKHKICFQFLEAGLLRGEATVYLVSEHKLDLESREIKRYGISVNSPRKKAFTIMSADEWYLKKGEAQAETIIANWLKLLKEKQKAGFTALRAACEMEVFFDYEKSRELLRYEAALGRQLSLNACALCLYNTHRLGEKPFIQLIKSHGHSIFKDIALKTT